MSRNALLVDAGLAVVLAVLVLILSPGAAVDAILALLVLAVCGVSLVIDRRRRHRTMRARRPGR